MTLQGFVEPAHPLSVRTALQSLRLRALVQDTPRTLWERDTRLLPWQLRRYRRRMRQTANAVLGPWVEQGDLDPHSVVAPVLSEASGAGLLTDMLPAPWGSLGLEALHPLPMVFCLKMEELCAVCGGLGLLMKRKSERLNLAARRTREVELFDIKREGD